MSGETLQVYFLGTAGALPSINRNPACIMIRHGSDTLLFDCGEGAQQQMMRAKTGFTVDAIFITHWHADHYLGVLGLIQTMSFMGRTDPLFLYGPRWVHGFLDSVMTLTRTHLNFRIHAGELVPGDVVPFDGYSVRAFATDHGLPGLGYILEEDSRPGRFDREGAIALGVPPGPMFGRLQRGERVKVVREDGSEAEVAPDDVMGPPRPGRKIIYTGDTRPNPQDWQEWGMDADLLIHDATYDDSEKERAKEVFHATAGEAGEVATAIGAHRLALVHGSSRYTRMASHIQDAQNTFSGEVIAPCDLDMLELPFRK